MQRKTRRWLKETMIRAVKCAAQTAIATIGSAAIWGEVNWKIVLSSATMAVLISVLSSIAMLPDGSNQVRKNTPST